MHGEMFVADDGLVMMGQLAPQSPNPKRLGHHTQNVYVRVEEIDRHYERAVLAGAAILEKPTDQPYGERRYGVEDPEGHRWYFAQSIAGAGS